MAGIKTAKNMIKNKQHKGKVLAIGEFLNENNINVKYIIIDIEKDKGYKTIYDYGSDVHFSNKIKQGDIIKLNIISDYSAEWVKC